MDKQCVRWKTFKAKNLRGLDCQSGFADLVDLYYRGTLIHSILSMKTGKPIDFAHAARMAQEEFQAARKNGRFGHAPGECFWYLGHFVEWIASFGYHIELTGDEFEPYCLSEKLI